jgi:hypothetical protein
VTRTAIPLTLAVICAAAAAVPIAAQRARPDTIAGCPADPVPFDKCAKDKIKTFMPPRTADGKPDFQGYWNANRQAFDLEEHPQSFAYNGEPTIIVDPADGKVPYTQAARAKHEDWKSKTLTPPSIEYLDPNAQCFLRGVPRQMWMMDYEFVQPAGSPFIFTVHEQNHAYRAIKMDGSPHLAKDIKLWMGDSRGRWEGNTLVIDVTNANGREWLDNTGAMYGENVHITERFAMVDTNTILYEATIDDPSYFTQPWTMTFPLRRNTDPAFEIMEFACHEGNRSPALQLKLGQQQKQN